MTEQRPERIRTALRVLWITLGVTALAAVLARILGLDDFETPMMIAALYLVVLGCIAAFLIGRASNIARVFYAVTVWALFMFVVASDDLRTSSIAIVLYLTLPAYLYVGYILLHKESIAWFTSEQKQKLTAKLVATVAVALVVSVGALWSTYIVHTVFRGWETQLYGAVDLGGKPLFENRFRALGAFDPKTGLAAAALLGGKLGYIDRSGSFVIEPRFDGARRFEHGVAWVQAGDSWGLIDAAGKVMVAPKYSEISFADREGVKRVKLGGKSGLIDRHGQVLVEPKYDMVSFPDAESGLLVIGSGNRFGFADRTGRTLIEPRFEKIGGNFRAGLAPVMEARKWGFIDRTGVFVIPPEFGDARGFYGDVAAVRTNGKWGFIDSKGAYVVAPRFDDVNDFDRESKLAAVKVGKVWGFIDRAGSFVVEPQYTAENAPGALRYRAGLAAVMLEGKWGFIDRAGKVVIAPRFDRPAAFDDESGLARVRIGEKWGLLDRGGKLVVEAIYERIWFDAETGFAEAAFLLRPGFVEGHFLDRTGKVVLKSRGSVGGSIGQSVVIRTSVWRYCIAESFCIF